MMPKATEYYVVVRPGEDGDDTILLNTAQGPQVIPIFTEAEKANRFFVVWKMPGCRVRRVALSDLLAHLRWLLLNGVPMLIVDPDSTSVGGAGEILHFLAEMEQADADA